MQSCSDYRSWWLGNTMLSNVREHCSRCKNLRQLVKICQPHKIEARALISCCERRTTEYEVYNTTLTNSNTTFDLECIDKNELFLWLKIY